MDKVIITVQRPIDPAEMGDEAVVPIQMGDGGGDGASAWTDITKSPLVLAEGETPPPEPPLPAGARERGKPAGQVLNDVEVVPRKPGEPLVRTLPREQQVQQLRPAAAAKAATTPEDQRLADFVRSLDMDPSAMGLEEPPEIVPGPAVPGPRALAPAPVGDLIENARNHALAVMSALPEGVEIFIGSGLDEHGVQFVMGLGILVGAKQVVYRGEGHYRLAPAVRAAMRAKR